MLSQKQIHPAKNCYQKLLIKLLLLLLMLITTWSSLWTNTLAAPPPRGSINQTSPTAIDITPSTLLTTTQEISTVDSPQGVCPTAEASWVADYQSLIAQKLFQTTLNLAGTMSASSLPSKRVNILLLGSDSRPGEKFGHTDTIILATLDPVAKTAGMFSIPRDLWVAIPGYGENRINMAYRLGEVKGQPGDGIPLLMETIEANLGTPIDFYALVDFEGFKQVVDTLGGIEICAPETIDAAAYYGYTSTFINSQEYYSFVPANESDIPTTGLDNQNINDIPALDLNNGYKFLYIEAGPHTLPGEAALSYARSRASVTADFARVQRQQAVLLAMRDKALQTGIIFKLPELWAALEQTVTTNLTLSDMLQLAQVAYQIDPANIQTAAISHQQTVSYRTKSGASVLLPKRVEIRILVEQMFGPVYPTAEPTQAEIEAGLTPISPTTIAQAEIK